MPHGTNVAPQHPFVHPVPKAPSRVHQIIKLKPGHRFSIDNDIIDIHAKKIGATGVAIYAVLARHANRQTGECWPTIGRIARTLDLARSTVKVYLRKMEKAGLIAIEERQDPQGDPTSNLYTLLDPSPDAIEQRRETAAAALEGGRPADDLPGRPADNPEPSSLREEEQRLNQDTDAYAAEKDEHPHPRRMENLCPHPLEERSHFGEVTVCQHCWTLIDVQEGTTLGDPAQGEEGQAHATCAA
jgi:DNA-binding MarR family transcriptional regulator